MFKKIKLFGGFSGFRIQKSPESGSETVASMFFIVQVLDDGRPFLDMAHVITNLNRLDAGIPDTVGGGGGGGLP